MGLIPEELLIDEAKTEFLYFDASVKGGIRPFSSHLSFCCVLFPLIVVWLQYFSGFSGRFARYEDRHNNILLRGLKSELNLDLV